MGSVALAQIAADEDRLPRRPGQWLMLMVMAVIVGMGVGAVGLWRRSVAGQVEPEPGQ